MAATATYAMKMRSLHASQTIMMAATSPSRMVVQMMSFRISISKLSAFLVQPRPRNLQHFVQYPLSRYISFMVSFFRQCLHSVGSRWASPLITLIWILQSFLSVFVRQCRIDFLLAGFAQHFRIPFLQRHVTTTVKASSGFSHVTPPPLAAEHSDSDSGRPYRRVSPPHRSDIRMIPVRFSCRVSA